MSSSIPLKKRRAGKSEASRQMQLNDDEAEKRSRRRESGRHLLDGNSGSSGSSTNRGANGTASSSGSGGANTMPSAPILANFEQWMKLVKDNKINATNSWNFALIDYFYDMSLLREGDGINFQKASYTLDGCVKIYTSRVDSVATETGRLLSGLADRNDMRRQAMEDEEEDNEAAEGGNDKATRQNGENGAEGDNDEQDDEEGGQKSKKKSRKARAGKTIAADYSSFRAKKLDLELSVDPLFRKMCADFDEGGASGLLLNSLTIDSNGRVAFDGEVDEPENRRKPDRKSESLPEVKEEEEEEDDRQANVGENVDGEEDADEDESMEDAVEESDDDDQEKDDTTAMEIEEQQQESTKEDDWVPIDMISLAQFIPENLDDLTVCPSLGSIYETLKDPQLKTSDLSEVAQLRNHFDNATNGIDFNDIGNIGDDDDDDYGGMEFGADGFDIGEYGVAAENTPETAGGSYGGQAGAYQEGDGDTSFTSNAEESNRRMNRKTDDLLAYFDDALKKNWAGPEHWKIQRLKGVSQKKTGDNNSGSAPGAAITTGAARKTRKEPVLIDFSTPELDVGTLFADAGTSTLLPKSQWTSRTHNTLPVDEHFSSKDLMHLFLKPKRVAKTFSRFRVARPVDIEEEMAAEQQPQDERQEEAEFWAQQYNSNDDDVNLRRDANENNAGEEDDDDMGPGPDNFYDAEEFAPTNETQMPLTDSNGGRKFSRPDYVNYARVAKKVNIKLLKDNIWKAMDLGENRNDKAERNFTEVARSLKDAYPDKQLSEISTSFCFICMLHLANEQGLELQDNDEHTEVAIKWDPKVKA